MTAGLNSAQDQTHPARDHVPVDASGSDVDLVATLGWQPRGVRANSAGTLNYRMIDSDADRSDEVEKGEFIPGFFTHLLSGCTCDPRAVK